MDPIAQVTGASPEELNREIDEIWSKLRSDPEIRALAKERDVELDAIDKIGPAPPFAAAPPDDREGVSGGNLTVGEAILVGIVVAQANRMLEEYKVLEKVWEAIVQPALDRASRTFAAVKKQDEGAAPGDPES